MARDTLLKEVHWIIDKLYTRRKELGLSHDKLAELTKLNRSTISLIENKKRIPTILTLLSMCKALEISLADIVDEYESK